MEELLKRVGLSEGETKVYKSLLKIQRSSVGLIIKLSKISASKVYIILDKLIEKGLVSYIIENNIRIFSPTNPNNILKLIDKQQKELEKIRLQSKELINNIFKELTLYEEESAQIYKGYAGLKVAYNNLLSELDKDNEQLFFSVSNEEFTPKIQLFFEHLELEKEERNVSSKGIFDLSLKKFSPEFKKRKKAVYKYYNLTLPSALDIGKNRILLPIFGENPIVFEIVSKRIAQRYREYFYKLWEKI